jgi:hypothetical protein
MAKITDFDKYIKERRAVAPAFTLFGKTYRLPPTLPYQAMLYIQGDSASLGNSQKGEDDDLYFFELLFGNKDAINEWKVNPEFDMDLISKLTNWVLEEYREIDPKLKTMKVNPEKAE